MQKKRTDFYLCLPSVESLGMKVRGEEDQSEGEPARKALTFEIKSRQRQDGIITFLNGVTGRLEYQPIVSSPRRVGKGLMRRIRLLTQGG